MEDSAVFHFRSAHLRGWRVIVLIIAGAIPFLALLVAVENPEGLAPVILLGLAGLEWVAIQNFRRWGRALGVSLILNAQGMTIPEIGVKIPWSAIKSWDMRVLNRRMVFEASLASGSENYAGAFRAFNDNIPTSLLFGFDRRIGLAPDLLAPPGDAGAFLSALERFAPPRGE